MINYYQTLWVAHKIKFCIQFRFFSLYIFKKSQKIKKKIYLSLTYFLCYIVFFCLVQNITLHSAFYSHYELLFYEFFKTTIYFNYFVWCLKEIFLILKSIFPPNWIRFPKSFLFSSLFSLSDIHSN